MKNSTYNQGQGLLISKVASIVSHDNKGINIKDIKVKSEPSSLYPINSYQTDVFHIQGHMIYRTLFKVNVRVINVCVTYKLGIQVKVPTAFINIIAHVILKLILCT